MMGLRDRSVGHFAVFVATFAAGTGSAGAAGSGTTTAGTGVNPLHLSGCIQNQLDTVGALVVDTTAADGLRKIVDHGPRHPRQIAQVTVLTLRLNRHCDKMVNLTNIHT